VTTLARSLTCAILGLGLGTAAAAADPAPAPAVAPDKVVFATNWKAQAAQGGFYQALADGTYRAHGLDVEIRQGGPQVNNRPLLPAGRVDFLLTGNLLQSFDAVKNGVPTVAVAALFQKDPQALIAHPGQGYDTFESLKEAPVVLVAKDAQFTWWQWLKARHGFRDEQLRPYNYALGPFLANPRSVQQGYSVAEPIYVEREAHFKPLVYLLADHGFSTYSTLIEARADMVQGRPDLVQRFVDASILGWYGYLYGDRPAADSLMLKDNPEMTEEELDASRTLLLSQGILDSGDALAQGIGAMNADRVRDFYDNMVGAGLYRAGEVDLSLVADYRFVNKGLGLDAKARLVGGPHAGPGGQGAVKRR
jgi:NitT/TauT family transport system substrate-binding protein